MYNVFGIALFLCKTMGQPSGDMERRAVLFPPMPPKAWNQESVTALRAKVVKQETVEPLSSHKLLQRTSLRSFATGFRAPMDTIRLTGRTQARATHANSSSSAVFQPLCNSGSNQGRFQVATS